MERNANYDAETGAQIFLRLWTLGNRGRDPFGDAVRPNFPP